MRHLSRQLLWSLIAVIALFIAHSLEEFTSNFSDVDPVFRWFIGLFNGWGFEQVIFLLFHVMFWMMLITTLAAMTSVGRSTVLAIIGLLAALESYHVLQAVLEYRYVGGFWTALLLFIAGVWYWQQLFIWWGLRTRIIRAWFRGAFVLSHQHHHARPVFFHP